MEFSKLDQHIPHIPFRIRLGITGHRSLSDPEKIADRIRNVLSKKIFGLMDEESGKAVASAENTELKYSILTCLAEGADQLVAQEVMTFDQELEAQRVLGIPKERLKRGKLRIWDPNIEVVLPLPKEEYLKTFDSGNDDSRALFEKLFGLARRPFIIESGNFFFGTSSEVDRLEYRRSCYFKAGTYVVDNCDVLIALWDGQGSKGRGGTAEIVAYARRVLRPLIIISTIAPYEVVLERGAGLSAHSISKLEDFNTHTIQGQTVSRYLENVSNDLFNNSEADQFSEELKRTVKTKLLPFYVKASIIAKRSQNMKVVLEGIERHFAECQDRQELESLFRKAEAVMVRETQDWLVLMQFVELKPAA